MTALTQLVCCILPVSAGLLHPFSDYKNLAVNFFFLKKCSKSGVNAREACNFFALARHRYSKIIVNVERGLDPLQFVP
jgi:hypothetical protein